MARILFVDDDPLSLALLSKASEIYGHQAILANSGKEALQLASERSPDIIFVDLLLTDMDGLAVIQGLRQHPSTAFIPIVVLSAGPEIDAAETARRAGANTFIHKPIHLQVFQDTICKYKSMHP